MFMRMVIWRRVKEKGLCLWGRAEVGHMCLEGGCCLWVSIIYLFIFFNEVG